MSENKKLNQLGSDLYENDDFAMKDFEEETIEDSLNESHVDNNSDISKSEDVISINTSTEKEEIEEINPFEVNSLEKESSTENEFDDIHTSINDDSKKKKIIVIVISGIITISLISGLFYMFFNDNTSDNIIKAQNINVVNDEISDNTKVIENDLLEEGLVENSSNGSTQTLVENDLNSGNKDITSKNEYSNTKIKIGNNSNDEVINITEAILAPSSVKIVINKLGEFDGTEENTDPSTSFVKIKENSLVIPTVSKINFIPNVQIEVLNTQKSYSATDLIKIEFNVLLNSKTLSYSVSKKIYKDKDFIIDLSLNTITSDIVSIEENLIKEELTIPINIMNSGTHTIWFKINNYPIESYTYNIK